MPKELDLFGKLVMRSLRDEAFSFYEGLARGHWKAPALRKLQRELAALSPAERAVCERALRASVDSAIHAFLFALQEASDAGSVEVRVRGKNVAEQSDGLHGELFTPDGWQARFSKYGEAGDE